MNQNAVFLVVRYIKTKEMVRTGANLMVSYEQKYIGGKNYRVHRLVMEAHLGRKLSQSEHVHHKDGNKRNNAIDNLEILLNGKDHVKKHVLLRQLEAERNRIVFIFPKPYPKGCRRKKNYRFDEIVIQKATF